MNAKDVKAAVDLINVVLPEATAAYLLLKALWSKVNPGKTEDDYRAYLRSTSQVNIDETRALLLADGFVEQPDGTFKPGA